MISLEMPKSALRDMVMQTSTEALRQIFLQKISSICSLVVVFPLVSHEFYVPGGQREGCKGKGIPLSWLFSRFLKEGIQDGSVTHLLCQREQCSLKGLGQPFLTGQSLKLP